jgi:hypothetical protein
MTSAPIARATCNMPACSRCGRVGKAITADISPTANEAGFSACTRVPKAWTTRGSVVIGGAPPPTTLGFNSVRVPANCNFPRPPSNSMARSTIAGTSVPWTIATKLFDPFLKGLPISGGGGTRGALGEKKICPSIFRQAGIAIPSIARPVSVSRTRRVMVMR